MHIRYHQPLWSKNFVLKAEILMSKAWVYLLVRRLLWSASDWYYSNHISCDCAAICRLLNNLSREYKAPHLLKLDQSIAKTQCTMDEVNLSTVELIADTSLHIACGEVWYFWGVVIWRRKGHLKKKELHLRASDLLTKAVQTTRMQRQMQTSSLKLDMMTFIQNHSQMWWCSYMLC